MISVRTFGIVGLTLWLLAPHGVLAHVSSSEAVTTIRSVGEPGVVRTVNSLMSAQAVQDTSDLSASEPNANRAAKAIGLGTNTASLGVDTSFTAITLLDDTFVAPSPSFGVGPTQIIAASNGRLRSFDKDTGAVDNVLNLGMRTFYSGVVTSTNTMLLYPQVRFDRDSQRWFITIGEWSCPSGTCASSPSHLIAVSNAATITSTSSFTFYRLLLGNTELLDAPTLGIDRHAIYIGANRFSAAQAFVGSIMMVLRKSALLNGDPLLASTLLVGTGTGTFFAPTAVDNFDAAPSHGYFVASGNPSQTELRLYRVNDPGGTPNFSSLISVNGIPSIANPPNVPYAGATGGNLLQGGDTRLHKATIRDGRLLTSHHIGINASGVATSTGARAAVRWYELDDLATTPIVRQFGTIFDSASASPRQYWVPSQATTGQGHSFFGFSTAGQGYYPNAAATFRLRDDPFGSTTPPRVLTNSQSSYNFASNAWGFQSHTVVDPDDDMTAWTIQQFASATNRWGLHVAKLRAPPPPRFTMSPTTVAPGSTNNFSLTATSVVRGEGFFDPGPGFSKRLDATMTGFTVNSVQYVSPSQIVVNATANAGVMSVTNAVVTNPDGQSSSYGPNLRILTTVAENGLGAIPEPNLNVTQRPCGSVCVREIESGTAVSLTAVPNAGAAFTGWSSNQPGPCFGAAPTCNFTLTENITIYGTFAPPGDYFNLNVDQSTATPACRMTSDGTMIFRFLSGLTGSAIVGAGVPSDAAFAATQIANQIKYRKPVFDVDANGVVDTATDGILLIRYLAGFRGEALVANAVGVGAARATSGHIQAYLANVTSGFPNRCAPL